MPIKNVIPGQRVTKEKLERARELRREMTQNEIRLWMKWGYELSDSGMRRL
ncbi:MAG TPA: hypothetical protein VII97_04880 [Anaerolineales bacterium]